VNKRKHRFRKPAPDASDTQKLLLDLKAQQIEMAAQNEELRQARDALEAYSARYLYLYDLAPVGYCSVSESGLIVRANVTVSNMLGVPRSALVHQAFSNFVLQSDQGCWYQLRKQLLESGLPQTGELCMCQGHGANSTLWVQLVASVVQKDAGQQVLLIAISDISERKQAEKALQISETRFRKLLQDIPLVAVQGYGEDGTTHYWNRASEGLYGYSAEEALGRSLLDTIIPAEMRDAVRQAMSEMFSTATPIPAGELSLRKKDGSRVDVFSSHVYVKVPGQAPEMFCVDVDLSARKQAEAKLQLAAQVFSHAREGIIITNAEGCIVDVNSAFSRITGYSREEAMGQNPRMLGSGRQDDGFYAAMWRTLSEQSYWSGEVWNQRKDGEPYAEQLTISSVRDAQGNTTHYVALFSDITAIKLHQSQLEHMAHFDALTHLPNRLLLSDRLQQALMQTQRRGQQLAVVYIDIDGFKHVNDRYGHDVGDQLLIILANAMKNTLREGDTLARIGGDEFVAVLIDLDCTASCVPMLTRLLEAAAAPVQLGELVLQGTASVGVTFYPQAQEIEADQLLRQADLAMYQAKVTGKNRYQIFDAEQDNYLRNHHESLERIRQALTQNELMLYYQPKVNMHSGKVIGVEALIRWQHPEKGLLAPATFLPVIEGHSLAIDVGEWVIDTALAQIERWHLSGLDLPISVNVGACQLQQCNFVVRLQTLLANHPQVNPSSLELEILETSALADMTQVSQVIEACAQMGIQFALDDFGTGYSSLTYLRRLQVTLLKIDQSFVRDMLDNPDDLAILQGVIGLASAFKREVIAEGVETVAHGVALLKLGCTLAQGYGIARPMPAEQVQAWASTWQPAAAWSTPSGRDGYCTVT
jgi:diguanylate cyclase (GGDEF)-like protein/PAS domain S-box-containing protein